MGSQKCYPAHMRLHSLALPVFVFGGTAGYQEKFAWFAAGLMAVAFVLWLWQAHRKRKVRTTQVLQRHSAMREIFQRQVDKQSRMDLFPRQRVPNSQADMVSGRCVECDEQGLRLDFVLQQPMSTWPHPVVDIYFRDQLEEDNTFYSFTAVLRKHTLDGTRLQISVPLPADLRREQKRAFFRVTPQSPYVAALALWPVDAEKSWPQDLHARDLGKPVFGFRPDKVSQVVLDDISAGGARLGLEPGYYARMGTRCQAGDRFVLLAVLSDRDGQSEQYFWLNCLCVHSGTSQGRVALGIQFLDWCVTETLAQDIVWKLPEEGGEIVPLNNWLLSYVRERQMKKRTSLGADL